MAGLATIEAVRRAPDPSIIQRRIRAFGRRFSKAHLDFACHAALPLVLTPELLSHLWVNFQRDIEGRMLNIPWVAIADLLLSDLCDQVGHELYEMNPVVRDLLLKDLSADLRFGPVRVQELSDFLLECIQQQLASDDPYVRDLAEVQRWTALAYTQPSQAIKALAEYYRQAIEARDLGEQLRLAAVANTLTSPLQAQADFQPFVTHLYQRRSLIQGVPPDVATTEVQVLGTTTIAGVELPPPTENLPQPDLSRRIDRLLEEARGATREGNWTTAINNLRAMLALDPDHAEAADLLNQARQEQERTSTLFTEYYDFAVSAGEVETDEQGVRHFTIQVLSSPAGVSSLIRVSEPSDLQRRLYGLEKRRLTTVEVIALGEMLADLLFPAGVREFLLSSLGRLQPQQRLRLRLSLAPSLANIPWEYVYLSRGDGEKDLTSFLALDPRVSITRREPFSLASHTVDTMPRARRMLVALASPRVFEFAPLDLSRERATIAEALEGVPGIALDFLEHATAESLGDRLLRGYDIFHFSGHGEFRTALGKRIGTTAGEGVIVLETPDGGAAPMPAEQLAVNLRGRGLQLVVLMSGESGRRDEENAWSGVVAALMKAGVPAAVAMQYTIADRSAVAFVRTFYRALAAGLPLDQAVVAGRLAVLNLVHTWGDDPQPTFWRDWGVPVLYMQADQDFVLPAVTDPGQRQTLVDGIETILKTPASEPMVPILEGVQRKPVLRGKGLWAYRDGELERALQIAPQMGVTHILYKVGHGSEYREGMAQIAQQVAAAGLIPFGWVWLLLDDPEKETQVVVRAFQDGFQGLVFNTESDQCRNRFEQATQLGRYLRNAGINLDTLYNCSFPNISHHRDLPYEQMNEFCNGGLMPMSYGTIFAPDSTVPHDQQAQRVIDEWTYGHYEYWSQHWDYTPPLYPVLGPYHDEYGDVRMTPDEFQIWLDRLAAHGPSFFSVFTAAVIGDDLLPLIRAFQLDIAAEDLAADEFFKLRWPVDSHVITQRFGENPEVYAKFNQAGHEGLDFSSPVGGNVYACADSEVIEIRPDDGNVYGLYVRLRHQVGSREYQTLYGHLSKVLVSKGQNVKAGDVIALSGNTGHSFGPHLHLTLKLIGAKTPGYPDGLIDPLPYLREDEPPLPSDLTVHTTDKVRLRSGPTTASAHIAWMDGGEPLTVLGDGAAARVKVGQHGQWIQVRRADGTVGYVAAWYLRLPEDTTETGIKVEVVSPEAGYLNVRPSPSTGQPSIARVEHGAILEALEMETAVQMKVGRIGEWLRVRTPDGIEGYVAAWYLGLLKGPSVSDEPIS